MRPTRGSQQRSTQLSLGTRQLSVARNRVRATLFSHSQPDRPTPQSRRTISLAVQKHPPERSATRESECFYEPRTRQMNRPIQVKPAESENRGDDQPL
ncbi:Hypothetical predicted protein [Cloeon dipterum]|uniref:Uncharacterized protein n=1 Tax=Cloeon dipterum TaxID=197152 RepID=A0A8S1BQ45_9INSE|nr:Hypothetical predicted protein [Cloeon dipterum]